MKPVMLAIVGDSAAGKTTFTEGIVRLLGRDLVAVVGTDDYHKYDRAERKRRGITPLHPDCNHMDIMAQHLRLLAAGEPVLKPVYDHSRGGFGAPEYVEPRRFIVVEGLLALYSKELRDAFSVRVYLDPPEELRRRWKIQRDTSKRGYTEDEVLEDLERREPDSAAFIRPQREHAAVVVRFESPGGDLDASHLAMRMVLRPTIPHRPLVEVAQQAAEDGGGCVRVELERDAGLPVDTISVAADVPTEETGRVESLLWDRMDFDHHLDRDELGTFVEGNRERHSDTLAIAQLFVAYHLLATAALPDAER